MILKITGKKYIKFSSIRRNKECVHLLYGVDISVNAGNFMYFAPLLYLIKNGKFSTGQIV